jgi:hypothetical protein
MMDWYACLQEESRRAILRDLLWSLDVTREAQRKAQVKGRRAKGRGSLQTRKAAVRHQPWPKISRSTPA